ncbi:conserved exported hypothetical protein [Burkholderia diffusa]|uniref:type IV secretory system conjugative DNA transfer family protein n=1 Tax=Burkholderia diffusa TaxID=488732 RepID=UPI001CAE44C2|nr:type IV secretory system conjugative DNA transfer family protein [Burkholderia diffusa]CAG9261010.1 conserved exported hypothetical protein [Burkholderia diffusa]
MKRYLAAAVALLCLDAACAAPAPTEPTPDPAAAAPTLTLDTQSPAAAPSERDTGDTLDSLLNPISKANTGVTDLRSQMLTDAGKTVGFRGGMAAEARALRQALDARAGHLDTIFQFSPLINKNGAIAPVIVEARDLSAFSTDQIRTATRVYKIEKAEHFVSVPPTWRDYLYIGLPASGNVDLPPFSARPQDSKESSIWRQAVQKGWAEGEQQADAILAANFNRLTRDYTGMLLYSTLLQQGMISATRVAESSRTVTGSGTQLMLGDTLRRVTGRASFETDANKWRPALNADNGPAAKPASQSLPVAATSALPAVRPLQGNQQR